MRVLSKPALLAFIVLHPDSGPSLLAWYHEARTQEWANLAEVRASFASADRVGEWTVFNIAGNKYRLVVHIRHDWGKCFIRHVFTHAEYDDWNRDRRQAIPMSSEGIPVNIVAHPTNKRDFRHERASKRDPR